MTFPSISRMYDHISGIKEEGRRSVESRAFLPGNLSFCASGLWE